MTKRLLWKKKKRGVWCESCLIWELKLQEIEKERFTNARLAVNSKWQWERSSSLPLALHRALCSENQAWTWCKGVPFGKPNACSRNIAVPVRHVGVLLSERASSTRIALQVNLLPSAWGHTQMVFPLSQFLLLSLGFSDGVYDSPQDYWLYFFEGKLSDEKCGYSLWNKSKWEKIITEVSWDKSAFFKSKTEENTYFFIYPLNQRCVPWASDHMKLPWQPVSPGGLILVIWGLGSGIDFWRAGHFCIIHVNGISACVPVNPATVPKNIPSCVFRIKMFWREFTFLLEYISFCWRRRDGSMFIQEWRKLQQNHSD